MDYIYVFVRDNCIFLVLADSELCSLNSWNVCYQMPDNSNLQNQDITDNVFYARWGAADLLVMCRVSGVDATLLDDWILSGR